MRAVRRLMPEEAQVDKILFEDYEGPAKDIEKFRSHFTTLQLGEIIEIGRAIIRKLDTIIQLQKDLLELQGDILKEVSTLRKRAELTLI